MGRSVGVVRPDGSFDIPSVPPGNHILMANRMTRQRAARSDSFMCRWALADMDDVVLRIAAMTAQVTGTIKAVDNPSVQNVRVALDPMDSFPFDMHSSRSLTGELVHNRRCDTGKVPGGCLWRARWLLSPVRASHRARLYEFRHDDLRIRRRVFN